MTMLLCSASLKWGPGTGSWQFPNHPTTHTCTHTHTHTHTHTTHTTHNNNTTHNHHTDTIRLTHTHTTPHPPTTHTHTHTHTHTPTHTPTPLKHLEWANPTELLPLLLCPDIRDGGNKYDSDIMCDYGLERCKKKV